MDFIFFYILTSDEWVREGFEQIQTNFWTSQWGSSSSNLWPYLYLSLCQIKLVWNRPSESLFPPSLRSTRRRCRPGASTCLASGLSATRRVDLVQWCQSGQGPRNLFADPHVTSYSIEGPGRKILKRFNSGDRTPTLFRGRYCPNHNHYNGFKAIQ